jgi:phosphoadenosine phosphosulfate reductase
MNHEVFGKSIDAEGWDAEQILRWAAHQCGATTILASSFGAEDVVLIDLASRIGISFPIFTLDTDFLFPETYELISIVEKRYSLTVERLRPKLTAEAQANKFGEALWKRSPDQCCEIRKLEPLREKLQSASAWITGIRREQSPTRAYAKKIGWDAKFDLVKISPLADWTEAQVWAYIRSRSVPYNPLHDRNYPSIGCTHCTRPVLPGEDSRAGRWSGFDKTECGLHLDVSSIRSASQEQTK